METDSSNPASPVPASSLRQAITPSSGLAIWFRVVAAFSFAFAGFQLFRLFSDDPLRPTLAAAGSLVIAGLSLLATAEILTRLVDIAYSLRLSSGRSTRDLETDHQ